MRGTRRKTTSSLSKIEVQAFRMVLLYEFTRSAVFSVFFFCLLGLACFVYMSQGGLPPCLLSSQHEGGRGLRRVHLFPLKAQLRSWTHHLRPHPTDQNLAIWSHLAAGDTRRSWCLAKIGGYVTKREKGKMDIWYL